MFVIEKVFVDDKQLPKVLIAMSGLVIKMETPRPVVNAVVKNGHIKQASSAVTVRDQVAEWLSHHKGKELTTKEIKDKVEEFGGNRASAGYYTQVLVEDKTLKHKGRGLFMVN